MYFHIWAMDKEMILEIPKLLMELIVTGIIAKTIARTTYNICKANFVSLGKPVNLFVEEEARQFFEEVLHIQPTCYSMLHNMHTAYLMFNVCTCSMEVVHQKQPVL